MKISKFTFPNFENRNILKTVLLKIEKDRRTPIHNHSLFHISNFLYF